MNENEILVSVTINVTHNDKRLIETFRRSIFLSELNQEEFDIIRERINWQINWNLNHQKIKDIETINQLCTKHGLTPPVYS
jgi:hypothetical protein